MKLSIISIISITLILFTSCWKERYCPEVKCKTSLYTFSYVMIDGKFSHVKEVIPKTIFNDVCVYDTAQFKHNVMQPSQDSIIRRLREEFNLPTKCTCDF